MLTKARSPNLLIGAGLRLERAALAIILLILSLLLLVLLLNLTAEPLQGQTYKVIHNFTGGIDGAWPHASMTIDNAGNLYGTAFTGGQSCSDYGTGCGTIFELSPPGSGWLFTVLYTFTGGEDGRGPQGGVIFGSDGSFYGTTYAGGGACHPRDPSYGCGTVFKLTHPTTPFLSWTETVLYRFTGTDSDGVSPVGEVTFDQFGNIYGTTYVGGGPGNCGSGEFGCGIVYKLTPSGNAWTESVLARYTGGVDGGAIIGGVVFDRFGRLYGTVLQGGRFACGAVFALTHSDSGWIKDLAHSFQRQVDGCGPVGGVIFDNLGNLYSTTWSGGSGSAGTVVELTPSSVKPSSQGWGVTELYAFGGTPGGGPSGVTIDEAGDLYGTTIDEGAYGSGNVFKLTRTGNGWTYRSLYDFCSGGGGCVDGAHPWGRVTLDANGNLYGTTIDGGANGWGVVWQITP